MVFSSFIFLFLFLPGFLACYYVAPRYFKNVVVLLASYLFYAWGAPSVVVLLAASSYLDYFVSLRIAKSSSAKQQRRLLITGVTLNVVFLLYFKYANFFIAESSRLLSTFGFVEFSWNEVLLPIGISFFTFQKLSYLIDVYRGIVKPASSFINYALFVSLFPQLIAGPIVRYHDIATQIENRTHSLDRFAYGIYRFAIGLAKKVLIADSVGLVADHIFGLDPALRTIDYAWLGIICYSMQIYFDFSGYSDMAIGLAQMCGFRLLENFNNPYIAKNFTEFWRRWHISLSNWMREYLYISLGGNRRGVARTYANLWIVFLISGLWHGASWNFILWGLFHGSFLVLDKLFWLKISAKLPKIVNVSMTFFLVTLGWVVFRAETLPEALLYYSSLVDVSSLASAPPIFRADIIHNRALVILLLALALSFWPALKKASQETDVGDTLAVGMLRSVFSFVCLLLSVCALASADFSPFLYFKF